MEECKFHPRRSGAHAARGMFRLPLLLLLASASAGTAFAQSYPAQLTNTATLTYTGVTDPTPGDNTAADQNDLEVQADVSITKTFLSADDAPFVIGQQVRYGIEVSNAGPSAARDIAVLDTSTNLTIDTVTGACTALPCTIAGLAPGASATIEVLATIVAAGPFSNAAAVNLPGTDVDPDPDNNEDDGGGGDAMAPVASISVAPAVVTEDGGVQLVYTITFAQAPAVDTVVNLAFAGTATAGTDYTGQIGSILVPAGETSVSFDVLPIDDDEVEPDETVEVTVLAGDGYEIGTTATAVGTITSDDVSANLSVGKTLVTAGPFLVGQEVTYTIEVGNAGPSAATNVQVTDVPTNLTITSVSGACTTMPCTIASLDANGTATITVTATIDAPGAFTNGATVSSPDVPDPDPSDNTTDGDGGNAGVPGASISVSPTSVAENSGDPLVFTITLDQAPAVDTVITLSYGGTATPGADYTGQVATVTIPAGETTGTVEIVPVADDEFEPDETVVVTIVAGTLYALADPSEAAGTITNDDLPVADLSITKSDGSATYTPGGTATYVITVSNAGPDAATGVVVTDNLPDGVTLSGPWTCTASGGTCSTAGGGNAGDSQVVVTLDLDATGSAQITVPVVFSADPTDY